jgi:hypothetical protein
LVVRKRLPRSAETSRTVELRDGDGRRTDEPEVAASGEIVERDAHGVLRGRTRFFLRDEEMPSRIPVGEAAFLLWVLVAMLVAWLVVGVILRLT